MLQFLVSIGFVESDNVGQRLVWHEAVGQALQIGSEIRLEFNKQYLEFSLTQFLPVNETSIKHDHLGSAFFKFRQRRVEQSAISIGRSQNADTHAFKRSATQSIGVIAAPFVGIGLKPALLGAVIAGIVFIFFFMLARLIYPGDGVPFGLGDVYLAIFIGASVGLNYLAAALFYGVLMAGVAAIGILALRQIGRQIQPYLSYGTYLCLGTLLFIAIWSPL